MIYRDLGNSDLKVSVIGVGTHQFVGTQASADGVLSLAEAVF